MDEQEYKCCSCGKLAECAEEYATFGASFGCTGTDFRFYCKECFIETFEVGVHKDNRCTHCGKKLDFKSGVYSQPCGLYQSERENPRALARGMKANKIILTKNNPCTISKYLLSI